MIKGKSPEEIRKTFNITNDFTPEEEEQIIQLLPELSEAVGVWVQDGVEAAARRYNR